MSATKNSDSGTKTSFGSRETYLESLLKVLGRKVIVYMFILILLRKLVLSFLCMTGSYWALEPLRRIAFITHSKVVRLKVLNGLKRKRFLWTVLSKRQTVKIIPPLTLQNALRKSQRKYFAYLINC